MTSALATRHAGPQWQRGYPAGAPHLEQAWPSFARHIEAMLRQAARRWPCAVSRSSLATWIWSAMRGARRYWVTCSVTR
jgi:hypothetical protein